MKWTAISGSWRKTNKKIEKDVRRSVKRIILRGNGIVTGGALNVGYFATDEALLYNPQADHIKIYLPSTLELYIAHYRKRAKEGVITRKQAEKLIQQLEKVQKLNSNSIIENKLATAIDKPEYHKRNSKIIEHADKLVAFHVNKSDGVQDAIDKAKKKGLPVKIHSYKIS